MAKRKPRQQFIPGTEPPSIGEIDTAAEHYVDMRDSRMAMLKTEIEAHDKLLDLMRKHGLASYDFDGFVVSTVDTSKVKVKRKKEADEDES